MIQLKSAYFKTISALSLSGLLSFAMAATVLGQTDTRHTALTNLPDFTVLSEKLAPAVVNIQIVQYSGDELRSVTHFSCAHQSRTMGQSGAIA